MNRLRVTMLVWVLAVGGLGLAASSAHAQAPSGAAPAPAPRYYYGPGYYGYGYYYYPTAPSIPTYRGGFYSAPYRSWGTSTGQPAYDPTGRHDGLYRPWLRPLQ
jgi:hypothetical protein